MNRAVWPAANTSPPPGRDDHEATLDEMHQQLVDAGARAIKYEALYATLSTKHGRLLHACCQLLYAGGTLTDLERVVKEQGRA